MSGPSARTHGDGGVLVLLPEEPAGAPPFTDAVDSVVTTIPATGHGSWIDACLRAVESGHEQGAGAVVVVLPARTSPSVEWTRQLVRAGVDDVVSLDEADALALVQQTVARLEDQLARAAALAAAGLLGSSRAMQTVRKRLASAVDDPDAPVLLLGESGTGKALAARALHTADPARGARPFHAVDCGAVVDTLFGSELFGHVRGAFTGAQTSRLGSFATAGRGTLLLDEIGELSSALQAALLTALQERSYRPVGSDRECAVECRVITATNKDLPTRVAERRFRADLFYRLDGVRVVLPPLRSRRQDIPILFEAMVRRGLPDGAEAEIDDEVFDELRTLPFPGNVRQLETIARHCVAAARPATRIRLAHLPPSVFTSAATQAVDETTVPEMVEAGLSLEDILTECENRAIRAALDVANRAEPNGRKTARLNRAAHLLKISKRTLYKRLQTHGDDTDSG